MTARLLQWSRRVWGAVSRRRTDRDLDRELAAHLAFAEDELARRGHAPLEAKRLARASAGGRVQAIEALREQRGLPWLDSSWLDVKLGLRLLVRNWGMTLVGGLAMTVAIAIATVVFAAFDAVLWSRLPLDEGDRVVALQVWDREAGRRRDTPWEDLERWRSSLRSVVDVGAFQALRRNVLAPDGGVELATVAAISASGFRLARIPPLFGRTLTDADEEAGAAPVVVIGQDVWQRRFGGARDVLGRELRLGNDAHTIVGVMPDGFQFPLNFHYWIPLRAASGAQTPRAALRNSGPEGAVFGRLAPDATVEQAHAEVSALGLVSLSESAAETRPDPRPGTEAGPLTTARAVPYTFAFIGDVEPGQLGFAWSLASLLLVLLLVPPCANIAILNYARTVTRQQEFATRQALGGSRARIVWQLFVEALVLSAASAAAALLVLRVVSIVVNGRLQTIPGGPPFWLSFGVSIRTLLFVGALAVVGAAVSGLVPGLQATGRLGRARSHGAGAAAERTGLGLGATWTTLVIAQVALTVAALPVAAQLAWGTLEQGIVGPGFAAENFATVRVSFQDGIDAASRGDRQRELMRRLGEDPHIVGIAPASQPPGEEPWVFVDIEGLPSRKAAIDVVNGPPPGFLVRFNQVDPTFFDLYEVPLLAGRRLEHDARTHAVVVNRRFAETMAGADGVASALGRRFRYVRAAQQEGPHRPADATADRWYEVVGVVGNLPVTSDAAVSYHAAEPGQIDPVQLQLRLRGVHGVGTAADGPAGLAVRIREIAARVDPALHVEDIRTLAEIYREHRFGDNVGAIVLVAVTGSVLLLSAAGLYALLAFTVAQRRREIGIRAALGAPPRQLVAAVFRRAFLQIGIGSAAGLLAAYLIGRYVPIEQVGGLEIPGILPAAVVFMLLVGVLAALGPARRGLRVDPVEALRGG